MNGRGKYVLATVALVALGLIQYLLGAVILAIGAWLCACFTMHLALTHHNGE